MRYISLGRGSFGGMGASSNRGLSHVSSSGSQQPRGGGGGGGGGSHHTQTTHSSSQSQSSSSSSNRGSHRGRGGSGRGGSGSNRGGGRGRGGHRQHDDHEPLDWEKILPHPDERYDIIDIGANLGHKRFSYDWQQVVDQAVEAGVKKIIITGTSVRDSVRALELAKQKPGILYSTAGVHPHDAKSCDEKTIGILRGLAQNPEVVAIGECGLDFDRMFSPKEVQMKWFEEQMRLAVELKKPVFLHERAAGDDFVAVLRKFPQDQLPRLCVHCFTGDSAEVKRYLELGCYIGITGWINDPLRGKDLQKAVKLIPLERLMIETDAPFLAPKDIPDVRISRNEPGVLPHVLRKVAECIGQPIDVVAEATRKTTQEFFGIN